MDERRYHEETRKEELAEAWHACGYMFSLVNFKSGGCPNSGWKIERSWGGRGDERRYHEEAEKEELAETWHA